MLARTLGTREFTGWQMPGVLSLFFGTIVGANLPLACFAVGRRGGLGVSNPHVASLEFNGLCAEGARQDTVVVTLGRPTPEDKDTKAMLLSENGRICGIDHPLAPGPWSAGSAVASKNGTVWTDRPRPGVAA